jgi:hypothetical protein
LTLDSKLAVESESGIKELGKGFKVFKGGGNRREMLRVCMFLF